jgi:2,3-bisphosphoglycerate-dependent phosphoglycerate mutase
MKYRSYAFIAIVVLCGVFAFNAFAQSKTIVLVRHAEKDTSVANDSDPALSDAGRERATRLTRAVRRFKPYEIFSTNTRRTRQTAEPVAARRKKEIQTYNASDHQALIDHILASPRRHFLIVGHSNTVPFLANLLAKKEVFRQVPDNEHGVIWVIRLRRGELKKVELFTY